MKMDRFIAMELLGDVDHLIANLRERDERIKQLEEALRRIHRECFDNLLAPVALKHRTLVRVMQECESVVETPNFGAALYPSAPEEEQ